jgi:type I restriction enzyme S subunit
MSFEVREGVVGAYLAPRTAWRSATLGEIGEYLNGRAFKPEDWAHEGLPIIRIQNLTSSGAHFNRFAGAVDPKHLVSDGDLLISWSASLDAFIWNRGPAVLNQHIFKVQENPRVVDRLFLYFAVREAMTEIRDQVHGATMQHITKPEFEAIKIPLPPLAEQKRIAGLLAEQMAAVDRARAAAQAKLGALKALPAATLRETFFSANASAWPRRELGEVCELLPSKSISTDGDMAVSAVTSACLNETGFDPAGIKQARMRSGDVRQCVLEPNEILVARSNTPELVGRAALFPGGHPNLVASDLTIRIRVLPGKMNPRFLTLFLSGLYLSGHWKENAGGASGTMKKITRTQLAAFAVPCPSPAEQERIAQRLDRQLSELRKVTEAASSALATISALPAALLRRAFSGELASYAKAARVSAPQPAAVHRLHNRALSAAFDVNHTCQRRGLRGEPARCESRVLLQKGSYLRETWANVLLGGRYNRRSKGPHDPDWNEVMGYAIDSGWIRAETVILRDHPIYLPGARMAEALDLADALFGDKKARALRVAELLSGLDWEQAELYATVFAAWNDLLLDGASPPVADELIVREVHERWHRDKAKFGRDQLVAARRWLIEQDLEPAGTGPRTQAGLQTELDFERHEDF